MCSRTEDAARNGHNPFPPREVEERCFEGREERFPLLGFSPHRRRGHVNSIRAVAVIAPAMLALSLCVGIAGCSSGSGTTPGPTPTPTPNPAPTMSSISPSNAPAGALAFTLTVNGSNFLSNSMVGWQQPYDHVCQQQPA